ncbi:Abi family protein [Geotalea sp. SG265]|uniref:Abi family protein n=1 Tax=Geotalea sp. SG265 TaxID=2922867 RepID=UPI001FAF9E8B|nr:Abi family protein [Geotalea sp. SG265]
MNFTELEKYISKDRLATYSTLLGCADLDKTIGAYYWNKALGGAVYSFLQCLEVSLRNSLHIEGNSKFGMETWYEPLCKRVGQQVRAQQAKRFAKLQAKLAKKGLPPAKKKTPALTVNEIKINNAINEVKNSGKIVSSANVISTLSLGFWVNLFKTDYSSGNKSLLWPESLPNVFPNAPSKMALPQFYNELKDINLLRNRFSHHEPLWKSGTVLSVNDAISFLNDEVDKIFRYVGYINTHRATLLQQSTAYKEFRSLNRPETFYRFIGNNSKNLTPQQFKADMNLYLKQISEDHRVIFIMRNNSLIKISSY